MQIRKESPQLHHFLDASNAGIIFALPWLITWFGYALPDEKDVVRLYDFFLATPTLMPVYLSAAIVLHSEREILAGYCGLAPVHDLLSKIPKDRLLPLDKLVADARNLFDKYPPDTIESEVEQRVKRLQAANGPRVQPAAAAAGEVARLGLTPLTVGVVAAVGVVAVTMPMVFVGLAAWKLYHRR
jgi:hypothetical protein